MARKKKTLTDPVSTRRPGKAAVAAAKAMLAPMDHLNAVTRQVELMTQQLDRMNTTLETLVSAVKERKLLVEPSPPPPAPTPDERRPLTEPSPTPSMRPLTEPAPES